MALHGTLEARVEMRRADLTKEEGGTFAAKGAATRTRTGRLYYVTRTYRCSSRYALEKSASLKKRNRTFQAGVPDEKARRSHREVER